MAYTLSIAFEALASPIRRRILDLLRHGERPVGELAFELGYRQPSVSKHLKALHDAGLVNRRAVGQLRYYRIDTAALDETSQWFEQFRVSSETTTR